MSALVAVLVIALGFALCAALGVALAELDRRRTQRQWPPHSRTSDPRGTARDEPT